MKPKELLFGPTLKGPIMTSVQSGPKQFAGRTTLNSGSATVTVSTFAIQSDSLIHLGLEGNANLNILASTFTIGSAELTATVSDAAIEADSLVFLQPRGVISQNSGQGVPLEIHSLAAGWFGAHWSTQVSADVAERETTVMYTVYPADGPPAAIEVKSISDQNFFTLGRSDGRAAARDTDILWQVTNTSHH